MHFAFFSTARHAFSLPLTLRPDHISTLAVVSLQLHTPRASGLLIPREDDVMRCFSARAPPGSLVRHRMWAKPALTAGEQRQTTGWPSIYRATGIPQHPLHHHSTNPSYFNPHSHNGTLPRRTSSSTRTPEPQHRRLPQLLRCRPDDSHPQREGIHLQRSEHDTRCDMGEKADMAG